MVKLLLITHDGIGSALLNAANTALGTLPLAVNIITVSYDTDPDALLVRLSDILKHSASTDEWLVLTDLYGATPCNIATNIATTLNLNNPVRIVSGLNLPMLMRIMNYPTLSLDELSEKALSGGKDGIIQWDQKNDQQDS